MINAAAEAAVGRLDVRFTVAGKKLLNGVLRHVGGRRRQIRLRLRMGSEPAVNVPFVEKTPVKDRDAVGGLQRLRHRLKRFLLFDAPVWQPVVNDIRQRHCMAFPAALCVKIAVRHAVFPVNMGRAKQKGKSADLLFLRQQLGKKEAPAADRAVERLCESGGQNADKRPEVNSFIGQKDMNVSGKWDRQASGNVMRHNHTVDKTGGKK